MKRILSLYKIEIFIFALSLAFSFWLTFHTFSYQNGYMYIAPKAWSDFSSQIPLIRSFSFGSNFPPEYPIFAGEPIHYHFLFYALVGTLERLGLPIDFAFNIPSAIGFALLITFIYIFARQLFHSKAIAALSILFFLFNGTLSFIYFFIKNPLSIRTPFEIISNTTFPSFGPYDNGLVSAFWNLNIYTNQRHLAASFAFALLSLFIFLFLLPKMEGSKKMLTAVLLGILIGLFFYFHIAVFLMILVSIFLLSIFTKRFKEGLIILAFAGITSLPQYFYLNSGEQAYSVIFHPGYLVANTLSFLNFLKYWIANLGLHIIFIPVGLLFANHKQRLVFIAFFSAFIIGTLFQFSPDIAGNHKFFNYFMIAGVMFTGLAIQKLWTKKILPKPIIVVSVFFLILSGIIDFFPVLNDKKSALADYPHNPTIAWIIKNTPKDAVFLNTNYLYDPASIAGRKIFIGWPYFSWSAGYNTQKRSDEIKKVLSANNKIELCRFMQKNNLSYLEIGPHSEDFPIDSRFIEQNFTPIYRSPNSSIIIYDKKTNC